MVRWGLLGRGWAALCVLAACVACTTAPQGGLEDEEEAVSTEPAMPDAVTADFSSLLGPGWLPYHFPGKRVTSYQLSEVDGQPAVRADAHRSASMLRRKLNVPAQDLGHIRFSWWVPQMMAQARMRDDGKADSPVRVVLAFDGDHAKLSTRNKLMFELAHTLMGEAPPYATLMYVWDVDASVEEVISSTRTDRVRKIVVDSGPQRLRSWRAHERDVVADFRRAFGEDPGPLIGVALMSDSDNTASTTHAFYGPVWLSGLTP